MSTTSSATQRIALVTGASRGIGRAAALALAAQGVHVIALARTVGALEALDDEIKAIGGTATLIPLDLKDMEALDRVGEQILARYGKLDIFIGNAGVLGALSPLSHIEPKAFDEVFAVNVTANWRLLRALDPALRAAPAGRVVLMTSGAALRPRAYWGIYGASKAALETLARSYADELRNISNVKVMLLNPGRIRTKMRAEAMPGEDASTLPAPEALNETILKLSSPEWQETGRLYEFSAHKVMDYREPK